jgi:lysophospholipase L1-like esterase
MKKTWTLLTTLVVLLPVGAARAAEPKDFFQKGDRIVFLGDSITAQYQYSSDIELYLTTRFPTWNLTFFNAGIGGDTATGGARRFAQDILAEKPTVVTIDFGMNDGGYGKLDPKRREQYVKNTEAMLEAAKNAGVRVALISPNAVDPESKKKPEDKQRFALYLETQKEFYAPLKALAAKHGAAYVDQYTVTRAVLAEIHKDMSKNVNPFPDAVHTSAQGGLLMAHTILVGLHAPALVSSVEIDAQAGRASSTKCKVDKLKANMDGASFDRTDEALPMPISKDWQPILPYVDQLKNLNWYGLKVTGLAARNYTLFIDGKDVGQFSAEEFAEGINLGNLTTGPIFEQGKKVLDAINAKNQLLRERFFKVVRGRLEPEKKTEERAKRMTEINDKQAEIYKLVQPAKHQFELKPAK